MQSTCLHGQGNLIAIAQEFSPTVGTTGPETVAFDIAGLTRLIGLPQDIAAVRYACARPASGVARGGRQSRCRDLAPRASGRGAACDGPSSWRPCQDAASLPVLRPWPLGIAAHELAALPPWASWNGREAKLRLRELARGEAERKLRAIEDPLCFGGTQAGGGSVELLGPLALLARLINVGNAAGGSRLSPTNCGFVYGWKGGPARARCGFLFLAGHEGVSEIDAARVGSAPRSRPFASLDGDESAKPQAAQNGLFLPRAGARQAGLTIAHLGYRGRRTRGRRSW